MNEQKSMKELTRIREGRGLSQQRLADASGVNKATINQIERGRRSPNVETLEKLASALNADVADFFPKAQAPLPLENDRWRGPQDSSETVLATEWTPYRTLNSWVKFLRATIKDYEPIIGGLPEKPTGEEYLEARMLLVPFVKWTDSINRALYESGVVEASNELWAASKTVEGIPQELGQKVREFQEGVDALNSLVNRARTWLLLLQDLEELHGPGFVENVEIWRQEYMADERQGERIRKKDQSA